MDLTVSGTLHAPALAFSGRGASVKYSFPLKTQKHTKMMGSSQKLNVPRRRSVGEGHSVFFSTNFVEIATKILKSMFQTFS